MPPIGGSAKDGSWATALTSWLSSVSERPALTRWGRSRRQNVSAAVPPAIHSTVGSKPITVVAPLP
jgi:hypothetical protein